MSTKIHATCDALGNPTGFVLSAGQKHDLNGFDELYSELEVADCVIADKAYDADGRVRQKLENKGCKIVIPPKRNRIKIIDYDKHLYKGRHLIENFFAKLKQYRAIATRYDKLSSSFLGGIYAASMVILLN